MPADQSATPPQSGTAWRSAAAQVLVDDVDAPELDDDAAHHLARVLRLRAGAEVCAADGAGGWRSCRFDGTDGLDPVGDAQRVAAPEHPVTVAFALVKGAKPELVVQKLTELGVDRIVVFSARRSVVRWDDQRAAKQFERLRRVAREACNQSRRLWLPEVQSGDLADLVRAGAVAADAGGRPLTGEDRVVMVGPEGGWDDGELSIGDTTADRVALGDNVLRAETAAIAVGVLIGALRSGLVEPTER
jgi:16S rRNA (uracil1498-N3)-methyltransferase